MLTSNFTVFSWVATIFWTEKLNKLWEKRFQTKQFFFKPKGNGLIRKQVCDSRLKYWNCLILIYKMWTITYSLMSIFRPLRITCILCHICRETLLGGRSLCLKKVPWIFLSKHSFSNAVAESTIKGFKILCQNKPVPRT